jgi:hypothetical protein
MRLTCLERLEQATLNNRDEDPERHSLTVAVCWCRTLTLFASVF